MMPLRPTLLASYFVDGDRNLHHVTPYLETIIFIPLFELGDILDSRVTARCVRLGEGQPSQPGFNSW